MFIASLTLGIFKLEPVSCGQWGNFWSFTVGFIFHHSSYCLCITFILLGSPPGYSHRQAMDWKIL